jgi:KUP system potassium uptake protein
LIEDFREKINIPVTVYEDNQGCIKLARNEKSSRNTKHMTTRFNFVKDFVESGAVELKYCPTESMIADVFTKPLHGPKLERFSTMLGLARSFPSEEECWDNTGS